jgi:hypothetical protein
LIEKVKVKNWVFIDCLHDVGELDDGASEEAEKAE